MKKYTEPKKRTKLTALFLALLMLVETIIPNVSFALSGGPSQPEVEGFTPAGTADMVDLFTGDFNYNIPLMDVDGYPINLGYQSGVSMDQEASWVGLGWNLNPGAINRSMRGLPDDFSGDVVERNIHIKPSYTLGLSGSAKAKLFGFQISKKNDAKYKYMNASVDLNLELFYNNYKGLGFDFSPDWDITLSKDKQKGYPPNRAEPKADQDSMQTENAENAENRDAKGRKIFSAKDVLKKTFIQMCKSQLSQIPGVSLFLDKKNKTKVFAKNTAISTSMLGREARLLSSYFPNGNGYTPQLANSMQNYNFSFDMSFGTAATAIFASPTIKVSVNWEGTDGETFKKGAYGAFYQNNNNSVDGNVLLDFNRDHDGAYSKNKPLLPMPVNMYDIYSISGQGIGGMFRVMRNGITVFHDDKSTSTSNSGGMSVEFGATSDIHTKYNFRYSYNSEENGRWQNSFTDKVNDYTNVNDKPEFELNYFKMAGEKNTVNTNLVYYKNLGIPYKPKVERVHPFKVEAKGDLVADNVSDENLGTGYGSNLYPDKRTIKNQYVSVLTYNNQSAFQQPILGPGTPMFSPAYENASREFTNLSTYSWLASATIPQGTTGNVYADEISKRKGHHIGEITVHQTNGTRYIYGAAAYNNEQTEYTVNIGKVYTSTGDVSGNTEGLPVLNPQTNVVDINAQITGYTTNKKGSDRDDKSDQYYNSIKTPGYAHSYLLSGIVQPDYVDMAPRGLGTEDLGNYTKFNYVRTASAYKWRTPAEEGKATFIEGLKSMSHDNKASFVEGTKELWYLQTIESKNHVAVFVIEPRNDARAILPGDGGTGPTYNDINNYSFRLKRIVLYTRSEYENHIANPLKDATPIKTVWFDYDYSLCPGIHNAWDKTGDPGKLTLKKVFFTYGNSTKIVSTYKFNYSAVNPSYNQSNTDRWGNYKADPLSGEPDNINFPYVKQDKTIADANASAWLLSEVKLPSGGIIKVNYESDDYGYVQNKRAAQMMKIEAVNNSTNVPTGNKNVLYDNGTLSIANSSFIFFKIPAQVYSGYSDPDDIHKAKENYMYQCVDNLHDISFKLLMGVMGNNDKEWISGYASLKSSGLASNDDTYFYVEVKNVDLESRVSPKNLHPFTKSGFNFAKANLPFVVNPTSFGEMEQGGADAGEFAMKLLGIGDLITTLFGVNDKLLERGFCKYITLGESFCRLNEPYKKKLGGGTRVKKITISDEWYSITNNTGASEEFGQEFDYTMEETTQEATRLISSGVAAYEPSSGSDENPFKLPIGYTKETFLSPDEDEMIEGPIGESFFPTASVGYSKVTVTNLGRTKGSGLSEQKVTSHGIGKTVSSFYTAKDFPTIVSHTAVTDERVWTPVIDLFVYKQSFEEKYISQGFSIECNDMHGKPKSVEVYKQLAPTEKVPVLLTGTYYTYKTKTSNPYQLDNTNISVIDDSGVESKQTIGVESEMYADNRKKMNDTYGGNVDLAFEVITISLVPIPAAFPFIPITPKYEGATDNFYSTTLNRVSTVYGIIDEVKVIQDGSEITTKNIAFDALTGDVLVTKTTNEFKKDVYSTTYPAHWMYDNMGSGYKNIGIGFTGVNLSSGNITTSAVTTHLCKGDEVLIDNTTLAIVDKEGSNFKLYEALTGAAITSSGSVSLKIVRSGRRNMQNMPIFTATSLKKPFSISGSNTKLDLQASTQILDAKAITYQIDQTKYKSFTESAQNDSTYFFLEHIAALNTILADGSVKIYDFSFPSGYGLTGTLSYTIPSSILSSTATNDYKSSFINKLRNKLGGTHNVNFSYLETSSNKKLDIRTIVGASSVPVTNFSISLPSAYSLANNTSFHQNNKIHKIILANYALVGSDVSTFAINGACNVEFKHISTGDITTVSEATYISYQEGFSLIPYTAATLVNSNFYLNAGQALAHKSVIIKPQTNLLYKDQRTTNTTAEKFANTKGVYANYSAFYNLDAKTMADFTASTSKWKMAETSTLFDPYTGAEAESKDALDRYRSVSYLKDQFMYDNKTSYTNQQGYGISHKPQLYIENGKQSEATVFNFETENELKGMSYSTNIFSSTDKHYFEKINFTNNSVITNQTVGVNAIGYIPKLNHTGNSSLAIPNGENIAANFYIAKEYPSTLDNALLPFYPLVNKKYVISGWVHSSNNFFATDAIKGACKVEVLDQRRSNVLHTFTFTPSGPVIGGWQRFYGEFTLENGTVEGTATDAYVLRVTLQNNATGSGNNVYFDDVRLHPFDANIKNYIYDEQHRVKAMLDENNYATFYMYNNKGELVTVRRETEKGIITIQENRKNNSNVNGQ
ncbi:MAG: hypothetical protein V4538_17405 [Bacteroidota bacterium]